MYKLIILSIVITCFCLKLKNININLHHYNIHAKYFKKKSFINNDMAYDLNL